MRDDLDERGGGSVDPDDDESNAVIAAVGRQLKLWREGAGLKPQELANALGYSDNLVYKVEAGTRIPQPEYLTKADEVLGAGGKIAGMQRDLAQAKYPKKVRQLAKVEAEAVELGEYSNHNVPGLLETAAHARALYEMRLPAYSPDEVDRLVEARLSRQVIFERKPLPMLSFIIEEVVLRRPLGGRQVMKEQLEHLLDAGRLRNVTIQVMPTDVEVHAGMSGDLRLLTLDDGATVGYCEGQLPTPVSSVPKRVRVLELRYGMLRAQALTPRESLAFIEKVVGEE
ncbi:helix-turn-helix domain-containing protein [Streptomyces montanisoli]|uniref:Helix-turn-helix domain-containing protein n=1 Tax=Streptomyces montanisoli TaxID=2798581 RepID=A0A940RUK5_9ACTN|nr:helix-turn-helix transcriptional regulator [Streptomyces montanisoli]MBP0458062.1 helix-turn-helix domain-containing protein [Streptomyces montanisoli]